MKINDNPITLSKLNEIDITKTKFRECYYKIIEILEEYCDLPKEYYPILSLWILGTYTHKQFETFPELFINASKGSGKSRLLKVIAALSRKGKLMIDLREAVLFRTASLHTICIDEFEKVGHKDNATLRTLINAAYKKGMTVERMKKVYRDKEERQEVETFDLYTPLVMANIWGIEDVLSDRCIILTLEKSSNKSKTMLIEDFNNNLNIQEIKRTLNDIWCSLCSVVTEKNIINAWNVYVKDRYITTLTTLTTLTTINTLTTLNQENLSCFNRIAETGIDGRNLELFFPLFILAEIIGEDIFEEILKISKNIVGEKKLEEYTESKDISLIDFISHQESWRGKWQSIHEINNLFRLSNFEDQDEEKWINPRWMGRALKRSKLINQKRRVGKGIEVMLDIDKAKQLLSRFKEVTDETKKETIAN